MVGSTFARRAGLVAALVAFVVGCGMESEAGDDLTTDYGGWDAASDSRWESWAADADADADAGADAAWETSVDGWSDSMVEPDVEEPEDAAEATDVDDAEVFDVCAEERTEPQVLYLSADDSNSQASAVIARRLIRDGALVPSRFVRTYEFLNYYDIHYDFPVRSHVNVVPQMRADLDREGRATMQIGVQGHEQTDELRRPMSITFCLDTSGSMRGTPIELEREVVRAIASSLREGDVVSAVKWDDSRAVILDSHHVTGPDDPTVLVMAASLADGGSTNLEAGLAMAYELAARNYRAGTLNRLVLVSDGQANTGVTAEELIAVHASDAEREGIYLVGVGTGDGYNDTLMDTVTDKGKGAYVFIDSAAEARRQFVDHFYANMEIAVMDVRVELTLPPQLRMEEFHGEDISTVPEEVDPQHLAPNDAMVFHQYLRRCPGLGDADPIRVVAEYTDPATRERRSDAVDTTVAGLLEGPGMQLFKGNAIVVYAEGLKDVYDLRRAGNAVEAQAECDAVRGEVQTAADLLHDPELDEIAGLITAYCGSLVSRHDVW
ncbi:MAG: VWA domain-containing protein [Deltaproteobacteria bacterium]|nr:VWA domain-containing protein [Deltaproteobacteria bacterium]